MTPAEEITAAADKLRTLTEDAQHALAIARAINAGGQP